MSYWRTAVVAVLLFIACVSARTINLAGYTQTWNQDWTNLNSLSQVGMSNYGTINGGSVKWIAHTPYNGDWATFGDPTATDSTNPFSIGGTYPGNTYLNLRTQGTSNGQGGWNYQGALLSSVDQHGNGFVQQYGYFEFSARMPIGGGTWPGLWLLDLASLYNTENREEIDIMEAYGTQYGTLYSTLHYWDIVDSDPSWGEDSTVNECSMYYGFHKYGVDIQSDYVTFYYDRVMISQFASTFNTGYHTDSFNRQFYVLLDLAYGRGGQSDYNVADLNNNPQYMGVQYVKVWQGSGGSAVNTDFTRGFLQEFATAGLTLTNGQSTTIGAYTLSLDPNVALVSVKSGSTTLWSVGDSSACSGKCSLVWQNDGNLVLYGASGSAIWSAATYNNNEGSMDFQNNPGQPYLTIYDQNCNVLWSTPSSGTATTAPTAAPTKAPTLAPTKAPTLAPTKAPTLAPTKAPTLAPTKAPTLAPTKAPTAAPTKAPTAKPTAAPTTSGVQSCNFYPGRTGTGSNGALSLNGGQSFTCSSVTIQVSSSVATVSIVNSAGTVLASFGDGQACGSGCYLWLMSNGNLVLWHGYGSTSQGISYASGTTGNPGGLGVLQTAHPYLRMQTGAAVVIWSTDTLNIVRLLYPGQTGSSGLYLTTGQSTTVNGIVLEVDPSVATFSLHNPDGSTISYYGSTSQSCGNACLFVYQSDGNLDLYYNQGTASQGVAFTTNSYGQTGGVLVFTSNWPNLQLMKNDGTIIWNS